MKQEEIEQLKAQWGRIYKVNVCDADYIIRPLYKADWDRITQMAKDNPSIELVDIDDKIVDIALLDPRPDIQTGGWATFPAGVISTLAKHISAKSGFIGPELAGWQSLFTEPIHVEKEAVKPTDDEVAELKARVAKKMTLVGIDTDYFVVRPITRQEWRHVMRQVASDTTQAEQDALIAEKVTVWPKKIDWDELPAGYATTLAQSAMEISGYTGATSVEEL